MAESNGLLNRRTGNRTGGSNPPLSAIFILKKNENGERSRKASLHAAAAALHSKGAAFSSHLHQNREALLVKALHFITLVKSFRCAPLVKFSPCGSKDGVFLLKLFTQKAQPFLHIFTKLRSLACEGAPGFISLRRGKPFQSLVKWSAALPVKFSPFGSKVGVPF